MDVHSDYLKKLKTADEIAEIIKPGSICASPTAIGQPMAIPAAVARRVREGKLSGIKHHSILAINPAPFVEEELAGGYEHISWFTNSAARKSVQEGRSDYMPCHYSEEVTIWDQRGNPDVFYATVAPMDKHGYFSFGLVASECVELAQRAKCVFLEVNQNMPRVLGSNIIHISQVTTICEHHVPIGTVPEVQITEKDLAIGEIIAEQIPNGATIQFGIGGVPSAVGRCLKGKQDLGIHTELFCDCMVDLIETGIVTNLKKELHFGKSVAAFAWGTQKMYDFLDDNMSIEMHPVSYVNNPYTIGKMSNFISVNSCLEIDLLGQVCAESIGSRHFSGSGGQVDFVRGCNMSPGGKSFIAISSTAKHGTLSKERALIPVLPC